MGKCMNNCTFCNGDQCELRMAVCSVCGKKEKIGELFVINGEYFCLEHYKENYKEKKNIK